MKLLSTLALWSCMFFALLTLSSSFVEASNTLIPFNPDLYPGVSSEVVQGTGAEGVVATVRGVIRQLKQLLAPILVVLIATFGVRLILAGGNEEKFTAVANNFLRLLIGVAIVILADFLSQTFFLYQVPEGSETATSFVAGEEQLRTAAGRFTEQIRLIIVFIRYVLGGIALFFTVKSGAIILFNADEETVNKQKEVFTYGFVGFILVMVSEALVNVVFDVGSLSYTQGVFTQTSVNVGGGLSLLGNVTNLLLAIMGGLFLFTLVVGGVMYSLSAGNEERGERASKLIIGSLLGLLIAFSSYTIVAEFSSGGTDINVADPQNFPLSTAPNTSN